MSFPTPNLQRRWKALPGEPVGDAGDIYAGYDRFGRTERMRWGKLGSGGSFSPLVHVSWGYSPASQKTWRKDLLAPASTGQDQRFSYDALYQVTQRQRGVLNTNLSAAGGVPAQQEDFSYDETGNWRAYQQQNDGTLSIDETRVNNRSNQMTQVDGSSAGVSYDQNGNMLTVPTGDALTDPSNRVVWDGWNRPVKVYNAEGLLIAQYRYDGLGRRITVESAGVTRHSYYDDQWRSIEERVDDTATPERQQVWHPSDRWEMILRDRSTTNNGTIDERLYPMKDQLDPVALSDDTGTVVERYDYTAFGIPAFLDSSFIPQPSSFAWSFLFHAEFQDADTGWFNYGYRYYAPQLGRWLSRDPIGERGGVNLYGFVANDPINWIDILGLTLSIKVQPASDPDAPRMRQNIIDYLQTICSLCYVSPGSNVVRMNQGPPHKDPKGCCCLGKLINSWNHWTIEARKFTDNGSVPEKSRHPETYPDDRDSGTDGTGTGGVVRSPVEGGGSVYDTPDKSGKRNVAPNWRILAHELCGHAMHFDRGDHVVNSHDQAINSENDIAGEHSGEPARDPHGVNHGAAQSQPGIPK